MKKTNIARIAWISSVFLMLIIILIAVIDYKVNYQYLGNNKLYFYDCSGSLCVTEVENNNHLLYSEYKCQGNCPIFNKELSDDLVLLDNNNTVILYNYREGRVISEKYDNYKILTNDYFIVSSSNKYGVITKDNKLVVSPIYDELGVNNNDYLSGYTINAIIAKKDNKYGIVSLKDGHIIKEFIYDVNNIKELEDILKNEDNTLLVD